MLRDTHVDSPATPAAIAAAVNDACEQLQNMRERLRAGSDELRAAVKRIEELELRLNEVEALKLRLKEVEASEALARGEFLRFVNEQRERVRQDAAIVSHALHNVQSGGVWRFKVTVNRLFGRRTT